MFSKVEGQLKDFTVVRSTKLMLKQHFIIQTSQRECEEEVFNSVPKLIHQFYSKRM